MSNVRNLWFALGGLLIVSFSVLLWAGGEIFRAAPPMPDQVVAERGDLVYSRADIELGRQVWQSIGGMQLGSIWGHGGYVAPDWSADWLHREAMRRAGHVGPSRQACSHLRTTVAPRSRPRCSGRLQSLMRANTYDPGHGHDHAAAGSRGRRCQRRRALRSACSATTRPPRSCAKRMR